MASRPKPKKALSYTTYPAPEILHMGGIHLASDWIENGHWVFTSSSNVLRIKYDKKDSNLYVGFRSALLYVYLGVKPITAQNFFNCNSLGSYVWQVLEPNHSYHPIPKEPFIQISSKVPSQEAEEIPGEDSSPSRRTGLLRVFPRLRRASCRVT